MKLLYDWIIFFLRAGVRIASVFNDKAKAFTHGRTIVFQTLEHHFRKNQSPVIWMHCASLGEFEQGRPVMESLKKEFPANQILLTFFSPSGYEVRKNYNGADVITYLPWDTRANAVRFVNTVNPVIAIFVKYEFWFHYFDVLHARQTTVLSISAIFRPEQLFFRSYGEFYRKILMNVSHFFVQNEASLRMLHSIGIQHGTVAGDTRFDRVNQIVSQADEVSVAKEFKGNDKVMVVGSCWPEDFDVLLPFINEANIKFIIAPHDITENFMSSIEHSLKPKSVRYSQATSHNIKDSNVLLIDNIGMLSRLYRYGEFAYVGGAFGKGLHNILEAACYGIPVFFGNRNYQKFQEAVDLIQRKSAFDISDTADLRSKYEWVIHPDNYKRSCDASRAYVYENLGATSKIMNYCRQLLS